MPSTSSSSLTNEVPKPPTRDQAPTRPPYTPTLGGQAPHSHQFPRTRKMFDKGPEQVDESSIFCVYLKLCMPCLYGFQFVCLLVGSGRWGWRRAVWSQKLHQCRPANGSMWLECQVLCSARHKGSATAVYCSPLSFCHIFASPYGLSYNIPRLYVKMNSGVVTWMGCGEWFSFCKCSPCVPHNFKHDR